MGWRALGTGYVEIDMGTREIEVVENLRKEGKAVCLGYEMTDSQTIIGLFFRGVGAGIVVKD